MKYRSRLAVVSIGGLLLAMGGTAAAADTSSTDSSAGVTSRISMTIAPANGSVPIAKSGAAWTDPASIPLSERREAIKRTQASYVTDIGKYTHSIAAGRPITAAAGYDPITLAQCQTDYQAHFDPADYIWKKNHFAACTLFRASIDHFKCVNGSNCVMDGQQRLDGELVLSTARGAARTIKYDVSIRGNTNPDFTWGTRDLTIPINGLTVCYSYLSGHTCTSSTTPPSGPLSAWVAGKVYTQSFTDAGTVGDPAYPAVENRSYFASYIGLSSGTNYTYTNFAGIRCDTASYVSGGGCIFDSLKGDLQYKLSDPTIAQVAQHVKDAQTNVASTKPGYTGTIIPGGHASNRPLTRNYWNKTLQNQSTTKVQATCKQYWGANYTVADDGTAMECDEYPFKTTYQDAASTTPTTLLSFSARPVIAKQNGAAGTAYGVWLGNDHILDGDPFWVTVVP